EIVCFLQQLLCLLEVDQVDAAAYGELAGRCGEDEAPHLRVPAARLVAEVNSSLQQLLHGDDCHRGTSPFRMVWVSYSRRARVEPGSMEIRSRGTTTRAGSPGS